jgi:hypothetical protein
VKLETDRDHWQTNQRLLQHAIRLEYRLLRDILDNED